MGDYRDMALKIASHDMAEARDREAELLVCVLTGVELLRNAASEVIRGASPGVTYATAALKVIELAVEVLPSMED